MESSGTVQVAVLRSGNTGAECCDGAQQSIGELCFRFAVPQHCMIYVRTYTLYQYHCGLWILADHPNKAEHLIGFSFALSCVYTLPRRQCSGVVG